MKSFIISDSTCRTLKNREFKNYTDPSQESASMSYHPNAEAGEIKHYLKYKLQHDCPDNLVVVAGLNDVLHHPEIKSPSGDISQIDTIDIANRVIDIGKDARQAGVSRISISTLIRPKFEAGRLAVEKVNTHIKQLGRAEGFVIIDQNNIGRSDMGDAVHVNSYEGTVKLRENIFSEFYTYRPSQPLNGRRDMG